MKGGDFLDKMSLVNFESYNNYDSGVVLEATSRLNSGELCCIDSTAQRSASWWMMAGEWIDWLPRAPTSNVHAIAARALSTA